MPARLRDERGEGLIDSLLVLGLLALVVALTIQVFAYAHARSVATAAAQDGAGTAATNGPTAGEDRARAILTAAGGTGRGLRASAREGTDRVAVDVRGSAPRVFPVSWRRISIGDVSRAGVRNHSIHVVSSPRRSSSPSRRARVARSASWPASTSKVAWCARSRAALISLTS
jgi:hypothetical protein